MAEVKDGPIVNSNESNFGTSIKELWRAVHVDANKKRIADAASEIKNAATSAATGGINVATAYVEGKNADIGQVTKPLTRVAEVFKGPESEAPSDKTAESPIADKPAEKPPGEEAKPAEGAKPPAEPAPASGEDHGWMAKLMFKFLPSGVKDWAATAAIPMVTQGQSILQNSKTKPVVKDGISSYAESLMGGEISVIPKAVKDYAELLLDAIGMDKNDEMATALSVGFISFLREQLDNFFPGLGIKKALTGLRTIPWPRHRRWSFLVLPQTRKPSSACSNWRPAGRTSMRGFSRFLKPNSPRSIMLGTSKVSFPEPKTDRPRTKSPMASSCNLMPNWEVKCFGTKNGIGALIPN
jgi:hypothetical protein